MMLEERVEERLVTALDFPTPASCIAFFELEGKLISPGAFDPFRRGKPLVDFGSRSLVSSGLLAGEMYVRYCALEKVSAQSALRSLALNLDHSPGLVALVLELCYLTHRRSPHLLTGGELRRLYADIYLSNFANLRMAMYDTWGMPPPQFRWRSSGKWMAMGSRTAWRKRLGHDVLISPFTQRRRSSRQFAPFRDRQGWLELGGVRGQGPGADLYFRLTSGDTAFYRGFPSRAAYLPETE